MSGRQRLWRVEVPLAVPYLAAGLRTAAVQVVATTALAAFVNGGGLGEIISAGFGLGINVGAGEIVGGGIVVALLAFVVELILAGVQRLVTPRPLRSVRRRRPSAAAPVG
jgi:osmoprotectant transport system permease protein